MSDDERVVKRKGEDASEGERRQEDPSDEEDVIGPQPVSADEAPKPKKRRGNS